MTARARTGPQRKVDTFEKLTAVGADTWVATASATGGAHLVPLSYAWDGECLVLAVVAGSVTDRNVRSSGRARLGFGPTRDVAIVDADLEGLLDVERRGWRGHRPRLRGSGRLGSAARIRFLRLHKISASSSPGLAGGERTLGQGSHAR